MQQELDEDGPTLAEEGLDADLRAQFPTSFGALLPAPQLRKSHLSLLT